MIEDKLLVWRFNAGDTQALCRIYQKYRLDLLAVAAALAVDATSAEDALHDVFVQFASQAGRFRLTGSLKAYLAICVANRARNVNRQSLQKACQRADGGPGQWQPPDPSVAAKLVEQRAAVHSAMSKLPDEQRQVIVLHVLACLRFSQIAQLTGQSINTIQSRYRYGLQKLKSLLDGQVEL